MIVPHSWHGGASDSCAHVPCRFTPLPLALVSTTSAAVTVVVANGLASVLSLAAAIAGHWLAAVTAVVASLLFAAGMIPGIAKR